MLSNFDRIAEYYTAESALDMYKLLRSNHLAFAEKMAQISSKSGRASGWDPRSYAAAVEKAGPGLAQDARLTTPWRRNLLDIIEEPDPSDLWVVDGLLQSGGISILSADPKAGKSTLARWLVACVLSGKNWLGRKVRQGPILYFCLEDTEHTARADFKAFSRGLNFAHSLFGTVEVISRMPYGDDPLLILQELLDEVQPVLIVVDTLMRFLRLADDNSYALVSEAMGQLRDLIKMGTWSSDNTHLLLLHHNNKFGGAGGAKDPFKAQMGSAAFRGSTDVNLSLAREDNHRVLQEVEGRLIRPLRPLKLQYTADRLIWSHYNPMGSKSTLRVHIEEHLLPDETFTITGLRTALANSDIRVSRDSIREIVKIMVDENEVTPKGRNGPYIYTPSSEGDMYA